MLPQDLAPKLLGVQCESCHGAGRYYQAKFVMKDKELSTIVGLKAPVEALCKRCHTEGAPSISPFQFEAHWSRIDHSKAKTQENTALQK